MNQANYHRAEVPALLHLVEAWRKLAGQQTEAIERSDWQDLLRLSGEKEKLKGLMDAAIAASDFNQRGNRPPELRRAADELVRMEQFNQQLLSERSRQTQDELGRSRTKVQRLRMIRNAYRRSRQTRWHSYL